MTYRKVTGLNNTTPVPVDDRFFGDTRWDASDANPDYMGQHLTNGAATSDPDWKIHKFTYSGSNVTRMQLAYGAWDDRATLF